MRPSLKAETCIWEEQAAARVWDEDSLAVHEIF